MICAKHKKNPPRTVDAKERTRFSKSRSNDLEDIGQGHMSSHATHLFMLLIICKKYGKNPSWTVDATGRTRKVNGQTNRQTDRQTGWIQYTPLTSLRGHKNLKSMTLNLHENGCKFSQTWLIGILVRHCIFENTYYMFRCNKSFWRYPKELLLRHIKKKRGGRFTPMGVLSHITL